MRRLISRLVALTQRKWQARCLTCSEEFAYPGIRLGAAGRPIRLMRCPRCACLRMCRAEPIVCAAESAPTAGH